jgi:hypothetical protein
MCLAGFLENCTNLPFGDGAHGKRMCLSSAVTALSMNEFFPDPSSSTIDAGGDRAISDQTCG